MPDLVSSELRELFALALTMTSDCDLRERFAKAGIETDELPLPKSPGGQPMETSPVRYRVDRYLASLDWQSRADIAKVLPLINVAVGKLSWHHAGTYQAITAELARSGLAFDGTKIIRKPVPPDKTPE